MNLLAKCQGLSLHELQKRLNSDGDTVGQDAGEGLRTTIEGGQDGAAEEGGNNTPASGISPIQDGVTTPVNLLPIDSAVPKEA